MKVKNISFKSFNNMSVLQFATKKQNTFNYISAGKAVEKKLIDIMELNESGSVNNIKIINNSDNFVFLSDGDILKGAKQNRVLNTSVFIGPKSQNIIPVSCVEQGRWHADNETKLKFELDNFSAPISIRKSKFNDVLKNLSEKKGHYSNQSKVWDNVKAYSLNRRVISDTDSLNDVFEARQSELNDFVKNFNSETDMNGLAIFIGKKLQSVEIYNRTDIYAEYFLKNIRTAADEIISNKNLDEPVNSEKAEQELKKILEKLKVVDFKRYPGVVLGKEKRFQDDLMTAFILQYEKEKIHTSILFA